MLSQRRRRNCNSFATCLHISESASQNCWPICYAIWPKLVQRSAAPSSTSSSTSTLSENWKRSSPSLACTSARWRAKSRTLYNAAILSSLLILTQTRRLIVFFYQTLIFLDIHLLNTDMDQSTISEGCCVNAFIIFYWLSLYKVLVLSFSLTILFGFYNRSKSTNDPSVSAGFWSHNMRRDAPPLQNRCARPKIRRDSWKKLRTHFVRNALACRYYIFSSPFKH